MLDSSPELVRLALAELTHRDYLQSVILDCSSACEQCFLSASCPCGRQSQTWMLTRKGAACLKRKSMRQ